MIASQYTIVRLTEEAIWIVDIGHETGRSVTNDAENVVKELSECYGGRRIFYQDSQGDWDELVHANGVFTGFRPVGESANAAIR